MEGFLYKKGTGNSAIGRKNWKRRWFLLEGAALSYYESFNHDIGLSDEIHSMINPPPPYPSIMKFIR